MKRFALQTVKFLPYPDRLSSEAHLWAERRAETSTMEDIQCVQINPSAAPTMYLHPHSYLHALAHLLLRLHAYILFLLPASPPLHPPTRSPLYGCCGSSKPDKVVQPPHLSYPCYQPPPPGRYLVLWKKQTDLLHLFSLLSVKSILFSLDSLVLESKTYWFL